MLLGGEPQQRGAEQRAALQVEGAARLARRCAAPPPPARGPGGWRGRPAAGAAGPAAGRSATGRPARSAKRVRSASCRRTSAQGRAPGRRGEGPREAQRPGHVVDRELRLQPVEEPEPLLGAGQRERSRPGGRRGMPSGRRRAGSRPRSRSRRRAFCSRESSATSASAPSPPPPRASRRAAPRERCQPREGGLVEEEPQERRSPADRAAWRPPGSPAASGRRARRSSRPSPPAPGPALGTRSPRAALRGRSRGSSSLLRRRLGRKAGPAGPAGPPCRWRSTEAPPGGTKAEGTMRAGQPIAASASRSSAAAQPRAATT